MTTTTARRQVRRASTLALALVALAATALPATAQGHEHGVVNASVAIAHDAPPDGRTFVGNVNHFAVVAHGGDGVPDFHQDVPWRVTLNGLTIVETTPDSGHDYDGVNAFDLVFPAPGDYAVEALDATGNAVARFVGTVLPAPALEAAISFSTSHAEALAGELVDIGYVVHDAADPDGGPIAHSDCTVEVLGPSGRLQFRGKTHTHEEAQELRYAYTEVGATTVRVLCFQAYPSARATLFLPRVHEVSVNVLPGPFANADGTAPAPTSLATPPAELNAVVTAPAGDGMTLVGTFDPYTVVGPDTLQHLSVLAVGTDGQTIQHVDFTATLDGPLGRLFESETLHEYDGILEFTTRQAIPGLYTLRVTAEGAKGTGELALTYAVAPPAVPVGGVGAATVGPVTVELDATPEAGVASPWAFAAATPTGPFAHGELEIRLTRAGDPVPVLQAKLHTHDDGLYAMDAALPTSGDYVLEVTPFPLFPQPVLLTAESFAVSAAPGPGVPAAAGAAVDGAAQDAPALPLAALAAALAGAALALRRRRA